MHQFMRVDFYRFKAFRAFTVHLRHFNILVGPNNAGKSTILAAFRILAAAMRRASARKPTLVHGPNGLRLGYDIDLTSISIAEENIFFNYNDAESAHVVFRLSNQSTLTLYFPEQGVCMLLVDATTRHYVATPSNFRRHFDCHIGFVPILGPVDHHETLYEKEAARLALFNYRAARNFRNIWYHYPEHFDEFWEALRQTWPGMDIEPPEIDTSYEKPRLYMYCPEKRIPRELFWSGFGFQVWCQMLTHIIQSINVSLFLIDEPDIYLHSDLQRQVLGLLRNLGPDIVLATHSTEIITEAETDDILLVNKNRQSARTLRDPSQLKEVFNILGSNINPILTQLARTRRVLFVEGKDFQILGRFARKLGKTGVGNRRDFAVVPVEGFNPERIRNLKAGMETTLGTTIVAAAILDRDYRSGDECDAIAEACKAFCNFVSIHNRKEIENFVLVADAIDRALESKATDRARRSGHKNELKPIAEEALCLFAESKKQYVASQILTERRRFARANTPGLAEASVNELALVAFEEQWADQNLRFNLIPGKDALSAVNKFSQDRYGLSVTASAIIDAMRVEEIASEMRMLVEMLTEFSG